MSEVNLLDRYPKSSRPIEERGRRKLSGGGWLDVSHKGSSSVDLALEHRLLQVARRFGKEYFDGDRLYGYGGYSYHPRFWEGTVERLRDYYGLADCASVLDVGCAKGFLLYDFKRLMPQSVVAGFDISQYACDNAMPDIKPFFTVGNARALPYHDNSFDLVVCVNTVDHLPLEDCKQAIREIQRVSKQHTFISVNAWRNDRERERLLKWNVTAQTCMHVDDWRQVFQDVGYRGDYWWFLAE